MVEDGDAASAFARLDGGHHAGGAASDDQDIVLVYAHAAEEGAFGLLAEKKGGGGGRPLFFREQTFFYSPSDGGDGSFAQGFRRLLFLSVCRFRRLFSGTSAIVAQGGEHPGGFRSDERRSRVGELVYESSRIATEFVFKVE